MAGREDFRGPLPAHAARLPESAATSRCGGLWAARSARRERHGKSAGRGLAKRKIVIQAKAIFPISVLAILRLPAVKFAMHQHIQAGETAPKMTVKIDVGLMKKSPRTALACVTGLVEAGASPAALTEEMRTRVTGILNLPFPRSVLESPQVTATRAAYKALGKDPARYRGSAEALLRRVVAGKGLPQINAVVDVINLVSVEGRLPVGLYDLGHVVGEIVFRAGLAGETYKGIGKYGLNLEGLPLFADTVGPHGSATSDSERTMVTTETKQVLAIIVSFGGTENLERWTQRLGTLLQQYASGNEIATNIVS